MKRLLDCLLASALLLLLTVPILLIVLLVKATSPGPVIYWSDRIGKDNRIFRMPKFRTMRTDTPAVATHLLADPSRYLTPIGGFLRKTSLDELPQFLNVLKGEMSVVGARPVVQAELSNYYKENAGLYCSMKPGITGPWQVGKRSDTDDYDERVQLDTWYVLNHSIWLDLGIIIKTVSRVLSGKGAY